MTWVVCGHGACCDSIPYNDLREGKVGASRCSVTSTWTEVEDVKRGLGDVVKI